MRRLAVFFLSALAATGLLMAFMWRVDPLGTFYHGSVVEHAAGRVPPCLVSDDLIGVNSWWLFKRDLVRRTSPSVVALGTSRVLEIPSRAGGPRFVNAGLPNLGLNTVPRLLRELHAVHPGPLTVYLGVELFWLNANWASPYSYVTPSTRARLRGLLTRQQLGEAVSLVTSYPELLVRSWHESTVHGICVLDRADRAARGQVNTWRTDGTLAYGGQLRPDLPRKVSDDFTRDLGHLAGPQYFGGYYSNWHKLSNLDLLGAVLAQAKGYGWKVVGFTPPYSTRYVRRLASAPETAPRWREFGREVPAIFRRYRFRYLDSRWAGSIGCSDQQFIDDGWHIDAACGRKLRQALDAVAR